MSRRALEVPLQVAPEVADALATGRPVVALESTIIAHGMPYPENVVTARAVEAIVRAEQAVPATIAVMDGRIRVGLDSEGFERLAAAPGTLKLSRADLAFALARGTTGATTVAATMICAHLAGIAVFATGGIGGVHRGADRSFDVSADLTELGETPVAVVAAGAKAILDVPATLEVLETLGVPVVTVGQAGFPAFWSRASGHASPLTVERIEEVAPILAMRRRVGQRGGVLVAVPIPPADEIPREQVEPWIDRALEDARAAGVAGKALTPFLLDRIRELSGGAALAANVALVENDARAAGRLARAVAEAGRFP